MKKSLACLLSLLIFFFFFLAGVAAFAQLSFRVSPVITELTVAAGTTRELSLLVFTGAGEEKEMRFRVYVTDLSLKRDGGIQFFRPGTLKRSAAPWIEINPSELVMKPEEAKEVKVKLTIPTGASGGYYAAIMVELVPKIPPEAVMGVVRTWRTPSLVELTVRGWKELKERARISQLTVKPAAEGKGLIFATTVENQGNIHIRGEGKIAISTKAGRRIAELPLKAGRGTVFPESMRDFEAVLEREVPPGEYFADATFRYGNRRTRGKISFLVGEAPTEGEAVAEKKEINFSVHPPVVEINAPPGSVRTINLATVNEERQPVHFRLYLKDIRIDPDGEIALLEKASTSWSCSNWIELKESEFELGPWQRKNTLGLLKIPKDVAGGRYARLVVEASLAQAKAGEKITTRVPQTTIMVAVGDKLERKGEVSEFRFLQADGGSHKFVVILKNTGDVHLIVEGGITLKHGTGETVAQLRFSGVEVVILPGGARNFTTSPAEPLESGEYKAEVTFFSHDKELVSMTKEVTVTE